MSVLRHYEDPEIEVNLYENFETDDGLIYEVVFKRVAFFGKDDYKPSEEQSFSFGSDRHLADKLFNDIVTGKEIDNVPVLDIDKDSF